MVKRKELRERQSAFHLQIETTGRDEREISDLAIEAFELSQGLKKR